MRVLFNTKPSLLFNRTGVGYYVLNLYRELMKSEIDVVPTLDDKSRTVVTSLSRVSSLFRSILGERYAAAARRIGDPFIGFLSLRKEEFDIYHETSLDPIPERGTKRVCTVYDLSFLSCPDLLPEAFVEKAKADISRNVSVADRIIVISEFVRDEVVRFLKIPEERIDVIPLAAASVFTGRDMNTSGQQRPAITGKDYLLYVGTVDPRKNLKTLIRAFREINPDRSLALVIAGGFGWQYEDILSYPEELGIKEDVVFMGYVDEEALPDLYKNALAFVYPSFYEGFGLPPLEAMACGVPVIISAIPALIEVAGDAALFFPPCSYEELAGAISKVLSSETLSRELSTRGRARAREYSWGKTATLTIQTYKKALER